jgi:hypothetical protein
MLHNVTESVDKDGNITLTGSTFQNPHVVGALVGTKSVTCETKAVGEELKFKIRLGVTKSIHAPEAPTPQQQAAAAKAKAEADAAAKAKADAEEKAKEEAEAAAKIAPSKPGTQAAIPATPEKGKTA